MPSKLSCSIPKQLSPLYLLGMLMMILASFSPSPLSGYNYSGSLSPENSPNGPTPPEAVVYAIQSNCFGGSPSNNSAYIQISETDADAFHYSIGSTFDDNGGANNYANATDISAVTFPFIAVPNLANPSGAQDYTLRLYIANDACFTDVTVSLKEQDCIVGCNCEEYIYLNEPNGGTSNSAVHKYVVNSDSTISEIGNPWYNNTGTGNGLDFPHGLAIDRNGFVYIGEFAVGGEIRKFDCNGNIFPNSANGGFSIPHGGQTNMGSIDGLLYANRWPFNGTNSERQVLQYDLCSGNELGYIEFCDPTQVDARDWGFYIDPNTKMMYSTTNFRASTTFGNYIYAYDESDFDTDPTTCVNHMTLTNLPEFNADIGGITTDAAGNLYIVVREDFNLPDNPTYLLKYGPAPTYTHLATSAFDIADDGTGWREAIGITYSQTKDLLYVSTRAVSDDCIAIFGTDLNYVGQGIPAPTNSTTGKGIAIAKECCLANNNVTVDTTFCFLSVGDSLLLENLINCDGIICEGLWAEDVSNFGFDYDPCFNSLKVTDTEAVGTFTMESLGVGSNSQCGAFKITVNIEIACFDYGDLPDPTAGQGTADYQTNDANNGPSHQIIFDLNLGATVDHEEDGQASADADGDGVDEDGFNFSNTINIVPEGTLNLPINVTNATGTVAHLEVWIDWNGDGDFSDPGEMIADLADNGSGDFGQSHITVNVPAAAVQDQDLAVRARLSHTDNMTPYGFVDTGEVEDYFIMVTCNPNICLPVSIIKN